VQVRHHLLGLSGDVVAADERAVAVNGVLAADADGRAPGGTTATWVKAGDRTSPSGRSSDV